MNLNTTKLEELLATLKKKEEEKDKNTVLWVLAIIGAVAAVAGIAFAVYRFFAPDYLEDFEEDFYDDFYYYFEEERYQMVGEKTGKIYKLGQKVRVTVSAVDKLLRTIDFELNEEDENEHGEETDRK